MHEIVIFDTETTSRIQSKKGKVGGEVIQFAAIFVDMNFNITRIVNRYCNSTQLIDSGAFDVHKLTDKRISILSDDKFFEQVVKEEGLDKLNDITWVGYNIGFDIRMSNQTLTQNGAETINFGTSADLLSFNRRGIYRFDAMDSLCGIHGSSYKVKLSDLIAKYIGIDSFRKICRMTREKYEITDPYVGDEDYFHNAFFASLALLLLIYKFKNTLLE